MSDNINKRDIGSVYCISDIDKYGRVKNDFKPILSVNIDKKRTLGSYISDLHIKIDKLQNQVNILNEALKNIIKSIGGFNDET